MYRVLKQWSWKTFSYKPGDVIPANVVGDGEGQLPASVIETLIDIGNVEES